jgi:iron complex transport system substrate-binding protein
MRWLIPLLLAATSFGQAPQRIVSTSPSVTEALYALGLGDRVVGVSAHCHYPPEAMKKPKIGSYMTPSVEAIVKLSPDLVILQKVPNQVDASLKRLGMNVLVVDHGDLGSMLESIRIIGRAAGAEARATALTVSIRKRLDAIRARTLALPRRTLLFIVGRTPGRLEGMVAVGKGSYLNNLIEIAGGRNVLADSIAPYPKISLETVIGRDPDVIVDMGDMANTTEITEQHRRSVVELWHRQGSLKSVRNRQVFAVASDIFVVPGPRMVDAALAFARMLYPEVRF